MSGDDFISIVKVVAFLSAIWLTGRLCKFIKLSPLIGWIGIGLLLGPNGPNSLKLVDSHSESLWKVLGTIGVTLMIAESGTHIHFDKIKKVGLSAVRVAIVGTFFPLLFGFVLTLLLETKNGSRNIYVSAFAAGCAMAPTSVGVALKLLNEANQLNSLPGQTIVTAAFLDDVFSIILLVILKSVGSSSSGDGTEQVVNILLSFIWCFLFLSIGILLAIYFFSKYLPLLLHKIPQYEVLNYQPRDEVHLIIIILILISYSFIGDHIGSHLLGAFIAGMSFSSVSRSMYVWRRQIKRISLWLIRLFFACSVAFTIPTNELLSVNAFWKGLIFAIVSGIVAKLISGFTIRNDKSLNNKLLVGFAMVGRGEFAYLVAQEANQLDLISSELYAIIVWSLLIAVISAPIAFTQILKRKKTEREFNKQLSIGGNSTKNMGDDIKYFTIQAEGAHHNGIHFEIVDVLHHLKLDILEAKVETDGDVDLSEFIVGNNNEIELDSDKIHEILHDIREAVGDSSCQVQLLPIDKKDILPLLSSSSHNILKLLPENNNKNNKNITINISQHEHEHEQEFEGIDSYSDIDSLNEYLLEIKLMSKHSPQTFCKLIELLENHHINLVKGHMEDYLDTDSEVIFGRIEPNYSINTLQIKQHIKDEILAKYNVCGEILVRKIRKDIAILPNHQKFSDLLQKTSLNNPLLSNKIQNGYEIDIICNFNHHQNLQKTDKIYKKSKLFTLISETFDKLELDIRTIHIIGSEEDQWKIYFFVQEQEDKSNNLKINNINIRRHQIESFITKIFTKKNIGSRMGIQAKIKIKAIEINHNNLDETELISPSTKSIHISIDDHNQLQIPTISSPSCHLYRTPELKPNKFAAITQSTTIITPKHKKHLPPSIEKGETTFNLISLQENNNDDKLKNNENKQFLLINSTPIVLNDQIQRCSSIESAPSSSGSTCTSNASHSILDILSNDNNEQ